MCPSYQISLFNTDFPFLYLSCQTWYNTAVPHLVLVVFPFPGCSQEATFSRSQSHVFAVTKPRFRGHKATFLRSRSHVFGSSCDRRDPLSPFQPEGSGLGQAKPFVSWSTANPISPNSKSNPPSCTSLLGSQRSEKEENQTQRLQWTLSVQTNLSTRCVRWSPAERGPFCSVLLHTCRSKGFPALTSQAAGFGSESPFPPMWSYFDLFAYFMIAIKLSLWNQRGSQKEHANPTANDRVRSYFGKSDCRAGDKVSMFSNGSVNQGC